MVVVKLRNISDADEPIGGANGESQLLHLIVLILQLQKKILAKNKTKKPICA
jgi:hypothetical protein